MDLRRGLWPKPTRPDCRLFTWRHNGASCSIKWYDFVTNDSVRSRTKLTDLTLIIADRRHSLLGHVCRLPPDVPAHNILQHCVNFLQGRCPAPDWKHPPGWPRKTWIQQVEEDHGCTIDSLWSSAQDRSLWRLLQPSLVKRSSEWVSDSIENHRGSDLGRCSPLPRIKIIIIIITIYNLKLNNFKRTANYILPPLFSVHNRSKG